MAVVKGKTFTLKGLAPGATYVIEVQSIPKKGKPSKWSRPIKFNTNSKGSPPPNVTNLAADFKGNTLVVTWDGSDARAEKDFKTFRVKVTSPDHPGITKNYFTDSNVFKFQEDQNRDAFGAYEGSLSVTVYSLDRTGNQSSGVSISVSSEPPAAPTNVKLSAAVLGYNVTWDFPTFPNYKETRIYHSTTQNGTYTLALTAYGSGGFVSLSSLSERWVKVAHVNLADVESEKVASVPPNITPIDPVPTDVTPPAVPINLNFEAVGTESVNGITTASMRAHWEVSEVTSGYKVRVTEDIVTKTNWEVYDVPASKATVTNKQLISGVATLTLSAHSFSVDDYITVFNVGAPFDGKHKITSVVPNISVSFAVTGTDVASITSVGNIVISSYTIKDLYPGTAYLGSILAYDSANNITQFVAEGPFTTPGTPAIVGSPIKISGTTMAFGPNVGPGGADGLFIDSDNYWYNTGYFNAGSETNSMSWNGTSLRIDGSINARSGSFSGNVFLVGQDAASSETDITASLISAPFYSIQNASWTSGTATVTLSTTPSPSWQVGDVIVISQASRDFDGQYVIATISGATITFLMSSISANVPSITNKGKITNVSGPDRVIFNSYGIQGFEDDQITFSLNRDKKSQIGGWKIGKTKIYYSVEGDASRTVGLNSSSGSAVRIWAGASEPGSAPFRVFETGNIRAHGIFSSSAIDSGTRVAIGSDVSGTKDGIILDDTTESGYENFWYIPSTVSSGQTFFQVGTENGSGISVKKITVGQSTYPKVFIKDYNIQGTNVFEANGILDLGNGIKLGKDIDGAGRDGFRLNADNYWYFNTSDTKYNFRVGGSGNQYIQFVNGVLTVSGDINVVGGNAATTSQLASKLESSAFTGLNILSAVNSQVLNDGANGIQIGNVISGGLIYPRIATISALPATNPSSTPGYNTSGSGFFLGRTNAAGNPYEFFIGNSSESLLWNGNNLTVTGKVRTSSGTSRAELDAQNLKFFKSSTLLANIYINPVQPRSGGVATDKLYVDATSLYLTGSLEVNDIDLGGSSTITGIGNGTTASKFLGRNGDGYLRWYDPPTGGGSSGVSSFNTRTGAVTLTDADIQDLGAISGLGILTGNGFRNSSATTTVEAWYGTTASAGSLPSAANYPANTILVVL